MAKQKASKSKSKKKASAGSRSGDASGGSVRSLPRAQRNRAGAETPFAPSTRRAGNAGANRPKGKNAPRAKKPKAGARAFFPGGATL